MLNHVEDSIPPVITIGCPIGRGPYSQIILLEGSVRDDPDSAGGFSGDKTVPLLAEDWNGNSCTTSVVLTDVGNDIPSFSVISQPGAAEVAWKAVPLAESSLVPEMFSTLWAGVEISSRNRSSAWCRTPAVVTRSFL